MISRNILVNSCNFIKMTTLMLFSILLLSTAYISAEFSDRVRKTSVKLFPLIDLETNGHFVISPLSIFQLMTSVSYDASDESKKQIKKAFYLPVNPKEVGGGYRKLLRTLRKPSDGVTLVTQSFMFIDESLQLNDKYNKKIDKPSRAKPEVIVKKLDFTSNLAADEANIIIEKSCANISNLLNPSDFVNSRMILTNVISFKGLWSLPFNESETTVEPFYDENGNEIGKVNMMSQTFQFRYSNMESLQALVLELPYGNDERYCMLIVLPHPETSVHDVYQNFQSVTYTDIFDQLQRDVDEFDLVEINVKLPRFKISTNVVLNKPLNSMGVTNIFEPGRTNFKKITKEEIYISAIVHKADIEVTESGTVASAATSAYFTDRIATPDFTASRPFIYFIMEKTTQTVIFSGTYSQPRLF